MSSVVDGGAEGSSGGAARWHDAAASRAVEGQQLKGVIVLEQCGSELHVRQPPISAATGASGFVIMSCGWKTFVRSLPLANAVGVFFDARY